MSLMGAGIGMASAAIQNGIEAQERIMGKLRPAEVLIGLGDSHFDKYSDDEMNMLFWHILKKSMNDSDYIEEDWKKLQWQLWRNGVALDVLEIETPYGDVEGLRTLFHRLWTRNVGKPEYSKLAWKVFRRQLFLRDIFV